MTDLALEALKDAIRQKNALIVCGSGVSKSADPDALDWKGLLKSGIEESVGWGFADENWKKRQLQNLDEGDVDEWIAVADLFTEKLGGQDNGHFSRWLANTVGKLQLHVRDLPDAISKLACPISTTNYDDILSKVTGMAPVPWSDRGQFINALNEKLPAILHLHGHWTKPESVILGTKSYQRIANDERAQFLQEFLTFKYSLVFVGCSEDGLSDQNLGKLKVWLDGWNGYGRDHFHLVTNQAWKQNRANSPIKMLKYGSNYQELPSFLLSLVPATAVTTTTIPSLHAPAAHQPQLQTIDYEVPREECFGRDKEIEDVVSALLDGQAPISIAGGPGMGKTTVAVNALYDSRIRAKYGDRRIFVALDAAREPHAILTLLAAGLGLPATGGDNQLLSLIGAASAESPILAILDNADTPHGVDGNRSNNEEAMSGFLQAKKLHDDDSIGLASCIMKIGELEYRRGNLEAFRGAIKEALHINKKIGAFANEANCFLLLGKLSLREREFAAANDASEAAVELFDKTGNIIGKAEGILQIGDIYLAKEDFGEAESAYVEAKEIINSTGAGSGGHLDWRFGEIFEHSGQSDAAEESFDTAIETFRIDSKDLSLQGWEALYKGKRSTAPDEARAHVVSARDAWRKIGRLDLIWEFIDYARANS
jgi:tetratricopeptide (TPR) repeat protein